MSLSVAARQRISNEIAEKWAERRRENLMKVLDDGFLLFAKGKPSERLAGYNANTLDLDVKYVTDPDYIAKLNRKEVPLLYSIQRVQQRQIEASLTDPITGAPNVPQTPAPPMLWPIVLGQLPPYVFEKLARDYAQLLRDQDRKEPERSIPWGVRSLGL